jgi:hypothetical protein
VTRVTPSTVVVATPSGPVKGVQIAQSFDSERCLSVLVRTIAGPVLANPDEVRPR